MFNKVTKFNLTFLTYVDLHNTHLSCSEHTSWNFWSPKFQKWSPTTKSSGSADVTDVGIQNLVFPLSIQKAGRVNLVNTRARWFRTWSGHLHHNHYIQDEPNSEATAHCDGSWDRRRRDRLHYPLAILSQVDQGMLCPRPVCCLSIVPK